MSEEIASADSLLDRIATLETQRDQANGRAQILQAQLGGWEAACAAQVAAARAYLDAEAQAPRGSVVVDAARQALETAIDSNAGELLLSELDRLRSALARIDRHVVGACESPFGGMPEPCEECGDMRDIAAQALKASANT